MERRYLIFLIILFTGKSLALFCSETNTSCDAIKTKDGYKFSLNVPEGSKIYLTENKTSIGYALLGDPTSFKLSPAVLNVDNMSFTTKHCRDITVHVVAPYGFSNERPRAKDFCNMFKVTDTTDLIKTNLSYLPWILCSILGIPVILGLLHCYLKRRHITGFLRRLLTFFPLQKREVNGETRASLGHGGDNEQGIALERVTVLSTESKADVNTPQSPSVDRNMSSERIQLTENGDISAHNDSRISHHRSMNRNLRNDPGGANSNQGQNISKLDTGSAAGNRAEHHEAEGQPLLPDKCSDVTGEARPLANKADFDQDQVSRCSALPNTDVESQEEEKVVTLSNEQQQQQQ